MTAFDVDLEPDDEPQQEERVGDRLVHGGPDGRLRLAAHPPPHRVLDPPGEGHERLRPLGLVDEGRDIGRQ